VIRTLLLALLLAGCDDRPKEWTAWVYPDASDLTRSETIRGFNSFERCQEAAIDRLRQFPDPDRGDYECGYMCRYDPGKGLSVCKETRK
jgi:hypothetical protein